MTGPHLEAHERARRLVAEGRALSAEFVPPFPNASSTVRSFEYAELEVGVGAAMDRFDEAISVCPECAEAYLQRGLTGMLLDSERGRDDIRQAFRLNLIELSPDQVLMALGWFNGEERRRLARPVLSTLDPEHDALAWSYLWLGIAGSYFDEGDFPNCAREVEEFWASPQASALEGREFEGAPASMAADSYEAMGDRRSREMVLRRVLESRSPVMVEWAARSLVEDRMHSAEYDAALSALRELEGQFEADVLRGVVLALSGGEVPDAASLALKAGTDTFYCAVLQWKAGQGAPLWAFSSPSRKTLQGPTSARNRREFEVARWELTMASRLLDVEQDCSSARRKGRSCRTISGSR